MKHESQTLADISSIGVEYSVHYDDGAEMPYRVNALSGPVDKVLKRFSTYEQALIHVLARVHADAEENA